MRAFRRSVAIPASRPAGEALVDHHGLDHLDLSAVTSKQRSITQTIATDLHDQLGAAAIRPV
jgi:hypothetical protein